METPDTDELAEAAKDSFKTRCALLVSALALILAVNNLGGANTGKEAMMTNILASNMYSFYQAKNIRQTEYKLAVDRLEIQLANDKPTAQAKELMEAKLASYKKNVERYETEPETGEGKKELMAKAKHLEQERDLALRKDPWFDYAEGLLQLAIVLTSVAIISNRRAMFYAACVLGVVGSVCTLNGYFLFY